MKHGLVEDWFPKTRVGILKQFISLKDMPKDIKFIIRETTSKQSSRGRGQKNAIAIVLATKSAKQRDVPALPLSHHVDLDVIMKLNAFPKV